MRREQKLETELIEIVSKEFNVDIRSKSRRREIADARAVFYKILYDNEYSLTLIGEILDKHHATVINGLKVYNSVLKRSKYYLSGYEKCKREFEEFCLVLLNSIEEEETLSTEDLLRKQIQMLKEQVHALKSEISFLNSLNKSTNAV